MKCKKCTKCKHENVIYCESCKRVECQDCGKTWGEKEIQYIPWYNHVYTYPNQEPQWSYAWNTTGLSIPDADVYNFYISSDRIERTYE